MDTTLIEMVARHEGFRATVYCDACGHPLRSISQRDGVWGCPVLCKGGNLTVGYGTRIDGAGLDKGDAECLLANRLQRDHEELMGEPWYVALDDRRRDAILDMAYTMGVDGVKEFKQMIASLERQYWTSAGFAVRASKWASEAPKRATEIAELLEAG